MPITSERVTNNMKLCRMCGTVSSWPDSCLNSTRHEGMSALLGYKMFVGWGKTCSSCMR